MCLALTFSLSILSISTENVFKLLIFLLIFFSYKKKIVNSSQANFTGIRFQLVDVCIFPQENAVKIVKIQLYKYQTYLTILKNVNDGE